MTQIMLRKLISPRHKCSIRHAGGLVQTGFAEHLGRECVAKHGKAADGFFLCGFVLQYIPVLSQETVFESDNIGRNSRPRAFRFLRDGHAR
jgi:hypothetical protein